MRNRLNIALALVGPESERGLIRLNDLLSELTALRETLECIDRELNGKSTLYYRVVNLSHKGTLSRSRTPSTVVIEPVLKPAMKGPRTKNRYGHYPAKIHHAFFQTINHINEEKPFRVSEPVIDAISSLLDGLGTEFVRGQIRNGKFKFSLDEELKGRVENLMRPEYRSFGSIEGQLLALNVARGNRFYIYPEVGPRSLSCKFPDHLFDEAKKLLRRNVRVYGTKLYRENTGFPFRVVDVESIELAEPSKPFPEFRPTQIEVEGPTADELVRESRENW
jgi:hypothetical protein